MATTKKMPKQVLEHFKNKKDESTPSKPGKSTPVKTSTAKPGSGKPKKGVVPPALKKWQEAHSKGSGKGKGKGK